MKKIILLVFITIGSYLGWRLGRGIGLMTAYFLSVAGSLVGVVVGVIINQRYLDL